MTCPDELRDIVGELHKRCPLSGCIDVDYGWCGADCRATCERERVHGRDRFKIVINPTGRSYEERVDLLIHEWAHGICWSQGKERRRLHSQAWGIALARRYRVVFDT